MYYTVSLALMEQQLIYTQEHCQMGHMKVLLCVNMYEISFKTIDNKASSQIIIKLKQRMYGVK